MQHKIFGKNYNFHLEREIFQEKNHHCELGILKNKYNSELQGKIVRRKHNFDLEAKK